MNHNRNWIPDLEGERRTYRLFCHKFKDVLVARANTPEKPATDAVLRSEFDDSGTPYLTISSIGTLFIWEKRVAANGLRGYFCDRLEEA